MWPISSESLPWLILDRQQRRVPEFCLTAPSRRWYRPCQRQFPIRFQAIPRVAPAREISVLFAAFMKSHLLGENQRGRRLVATASMAGNFFTLAAG